MKAYENEKNYISEVTARMEEVLSKGTINSSEVSNLSSDSNYNDSVSVGRQYEWLSLISKVLMKQ